MGGDKRAPKVFGASAWLASARDLSGSSAFHDCRDSPLAELCTKHKAIAAARLVSVSSKSTLLVCPVFGQLDCFARELASKSGPSE